MPPKPLTTDGERLAAIDRAIDRAEGLTAQLASAPQAKLRGACFSLREAVLLARAALVKQLADECCDG